jgi:hypothetical protein
MHASSQCYAHAVVMHTRILSAFLVVFIVTLSAHTQHNYRIIFQEYFEEKQYLLLIKQQTLERSVKKQDRLLAIHKGY